MSTMLRGLFSHSLYKHVHKAAHVFIEMLKKSFFYKKNIVLFSHNFHWNAKKVGLLSHNFYWHAKKDVFLYKNVHEDAVGFL